MKKDLSFQRIIISLSTTSSQGLFLCSLVIGAVFIFTDFYLWVFPPLVVAIYALILFLAQKYYYVSLPEYNRDSTYLLGFIFTLMCFIRIFMVLNVVAESFSSVIVPQIGSALLTSVVGLIARFIIIHNDRGSADQEEIWRNSTNELKENSKAYKNAQKKLTDLINHFVETREKLFTEEQKASKDHITLLSKSSKALAVISKNYPPIIKDMLDSLDDIKNKYEIIQGKSEKFLSKNIFDKYDELDDKVKEYYETVNKKFVASYEETFSNISKNTTALQSKMDQLFNEDLLNNYDELNARTLKNYGTINEKFSSSYEQAFNQIGNKLNEMQAKVDTLFDDNIFKNFDDLNSKTLNYYKTVNEKFVTTYDEVFGEISGKLNGLQSRIDQFRDSFQQSFKQFPDIQDEFLKTSIGKLESLQGQFLTGLNSNFQQLNSTISKIDNEVTTTTTKLAGYNELLGDGVETNISSIKSNIAELSTSLSGFNSSLSQSSDTLNSNISSINENIIKRLHTFNDEIKEIDELINSFLQVTKQRIAQQ